MVLYFQKTINLFFQLLEYLIFARVIMSWIPLNPDNPIKKILYTLTEPILGPIRKMIAKSIFGGRNMMLDFSPFMALILIQVLRYLLLTMLTMAYYG